MISDNFAKEQVLRLASLNFFPNDNKEAIRDLVNAAMLAETEIACIRAVDSIVHEGRECPKAADLRRCVSAENERIAEQQDRPKCSDCGGTHWLSGEFLITRHRDRDTGVTWKTRQRIITPEQMDAILKNLKPDQEIVSGAEMCHCHGGYTPTALQPANSGLPRKGAVA